MLLRQVLVAHGPMCSPGVHLARILTMPILLSSGMGTPYILFTEIQITCGLELKRMRDFMPLEL